MIEALLNKPYWLVDILPERVPEERAERYLAIEKYWLQPPVLGEIRRRFTDVLLKLNCYTDLRVCFADGELFTENPAPDVLASWICGAQKDLCILLPGENALITLSHDDTFMTLYNPSEALLNRIGPLVRSAGLFLRKPE